MAEEGWKSRLEGHKCSAESEQDAVEARSRKLFQRRESMGDRSTREPWTHFSHGRFQSAGFGKNALRENSPHTLSLSFPEWLVFGEQGTGLDSASMGLTQCSPLPFWGYIL